MKENTFSEKDSLELISQMLKQTKDNLRILHFIDCIRIRLLYSK